MRKRLDQVLVERGLCETREQAKRLIMAGSVRVDSVPAQKPSQLVGPAATIELTQRERYVSRGGVKLEHALDVFHLDVTGFVVVDIGASTGGFTDCLLQRGARRVYAVDVGRGQLAWKLRNDPRVVVMEGVNARYLTPERMPIGFEPADLVTIDCSFISLEKILPAAVALVKKRGNIVALIKPQFEAGKAEADKGGGVIRDPRVHAAVIDKLRRFVSASGQMRWLDCVESPVLGPAGNKEFFALIEKS